MLPVLMYHDIGRPIRGEAPDLTVAPQEFEAHVAWLAAHRYTSIDPLQWVAWRSEGRQIPQRPVLITFDDGYAGVAQYGLPILQRYGFRATIFLVTQRLGAFQTWDSASGYAPKPLMSVSEVVHWADRGFEFGCHTRTHRDLCTLSADEMESEVSGSRDDLEKILKRRPASFAYPWGSFNETVHNRVRERFDAAFSTRRGLNVRNTDVHAMRRSAVRPDHSILDFATRMTLGSNPAGRFDAALTSLARKLSRARQNAR